MRLMGSILGCSSWVSFAGPVFRDLLAWVGEVVDVVHVLVLLCSCWPGHQSGGTAADLVRVGEKISAD